MAKKPRRQNLKPPGKCIFCGGGGLSREHFWPEWAREMLPQFPEEQYVEQLYSFTEKTKLVGMPKSRTKNGRVWTKTIRVVCKACNETWMSQLETRAKAALTPLMISMPHTITPESAKTISQWVALKVMVAEYNNRSIPGDVVTAQAARTLFKETLQLPTNFRIWIAKCGAGGWQCAYIRHAATMGLTPESAPTDEIKNIHSITFGMRDLLIHVLHTTLDELQLDLREAKLVRCIYPTAENINWPFERAMNVIEANFFANTLDRLFQSPRVRWLPFPT